MAALDPLFDLDVVEDPYPYLAQLRETDPVHHLKDTDAFIVTRFDLIQQVVADTATFSSNSAEFLYLGTDGKPGLRDPLGESVVAQLTADLPGVVATADPPEHTQQRRVLSRVLSAGAIAAREPAIRAVAKRMLQEPLERGAIEWMADIAEPLPAVVVAQLLGVPEETAPELKDIGFDSLERISGFVSDERAEELTGRAMELGPVGDAYARARAGEGPGPDTALGVVAAAVGAGEIDDIVALGTMVLLISAGTESTTSLLGTAARFLAQDPALQQRLRDDPSLIPNFVEEACRVDPPFRGHYRVTTRDTVLAGTEIPAGSRIVLGWPAANRDEAVYDRPEVVDIDRPSPRHHVGFGWGIHLCVGAPLARLEVRVVLEELLASTTAFELGAPLGEPAYHRSLMVRRLVELPLVLHG